MKRKTIYTERKFSFKRAESYPNKPFHISIVWYGVWYEEKKTPI